MVIIKSIYLFSKCLLTYFKILSPQPVIKNKDDLDGPDKEIFLIKLPKEVI